MKTDQEKNLDSLSLTEDCTSRSSIATEHIVELDGIRALAIWSVLVVHLFFVWPTTERGRMFIPNPIAVILSHGWLGVDLFFVLSGFLITRILLSTKHLGVRTYFRRFYSRRFLRILPLCLAVIAVLMIAYRGKYTAYFVYAALLSANLAPPNVRVPDAGGPLWSLAVEEQYYLVWPWLVLWLDSRRLGIVAAMLLIIELFARMFTNEQGTYHTFFRLDGLAMGSLLAVWFCSWNKDKREAVRFALLLLAAALFIAIIGLPFGIRYSTFPNTTISQAVFVFGATIVTVIAFNGHRALSFLRSPVFTTTALLSYSLYLIHRPVVDGLLALYGNAHWYVHLTPINATILRAAVVLPVSYALASITRRYIELPFIRLGRKGQ